MTQERPEPTLPETAAEAWEALDVAANQRAQSETAYRDASRRCRALVVLMLRNKWARRRELVGRPFTGRALTTIQSEEGLITRRRRTP